MLELSSPFMVVRRHALFPPLRPRWRLASCVYVGFLLSVPAWAQGSLLDIGVLTGAGYSEATAVSADGRVTVGITNSGEGFRWSLSGGLVPLGGLNGGSSYAAGVNGDGSVIVGFGNDPAAGDRAFRWTQAGGMVSLGTLVNGSFSYATGVSSDGSVVVGRAFEGGNFRAFRWTSAGMEALGGLNGGGFSRADAISGNGLVIVGTASDGAAGGKDRAFRWTASDGMVSLGATGGNFSRAYGVNSDGSVVVGIDVLPTYVSRAFRWTQADGMVHLGTLNGGNNSLAYAVNADGNVVVGQAENGAAGNAGRAFRWTPAGGMTTVEDWLRAHGAVIAADMTQRANGVSASGDVVVGILDNNSAFVARASSDVGTGLIDLQQYNATLAGGAVLPSMAIHDADLVVHGAHGSPLRAFVPVGKSSFWVAGDFGRNDRNAADTHLGTGEVGLGRRLNEAAQIQAALGRTGSQQNLAAGGEARQTGTYLVPELLWKAGEQLHVSLAGYYNSGTSKVRRGYLNAGASDYSSGEPGVSTRSLRARVDWLNAFQWGAAGFTPYTSFTRTRTRLDGYTEAGGGFPARWDARTEKSSVLRVGVDAVYPVSENLRLLGRLEGNRRAERSGADASGNVLGLYDFRFAGLDLRRTWLRTGAGMEAKAGAGTASVMLNVTTQGGTPAYWLAASYRVSF